MATGAMRSPLRSHDAPQAPHPTAAPEPHVPPIPPPHQGHVPRPIIRLHASRSAHASNPPPMGTRAVLSTLRMTSASAPSGKKNTHANASRNAPQ